MALDPSIILGVKQPQFESPTNQLAKLLQVQEMQQLGRVREMQMQDAQASRERKNRLSALLAGDYETPESREAALMKGGFYEESQGMRKSRFDAAKAEADAQKTQADTEKVRIQTMRERVNFAGQLLNGVKDQATYDQAREVAMRNGLDVSSMPAQYDPARIEQAKAQTLTVAEQLEQVWKRKGFDLDVSKFKESQRHNKTQEGVAAGNLALARQRLAFDQSQPKGVLDSERGLLVDPRTGEARPVTMNGKAVGTSFKPLTEGQAKANLFGSRMSESDKILTALEGKYSPAAVNTKTAVEGWPVVGGVLGATANAALSSAGQQAEQAQRDFINAVLRRESGAVISDQEFINARKQYLPQPGDSEKVLEQKRKNRKLAIEGMAAEIPGGFRSAPTMRSPGGSDQFKIIGVE